MCRGIVFLDVYVGEDGLEFPRARATDCYFHAPFKFHAADADVTRDGWGLKQYDDELGLWVRP
eukprot:5779034-Lingulodinium_polyedra.AAC.1